MYVTGFYARSDNDKKEFGAVGEEMLHAILYFEDSDKYRFVDLNSALIMTTS